MQIIQIELEEILLSDIDAVAKDVQTVSKDQLGEIKAHLFDDKCIRLKKHPNLFFIKRICEGS